MTVLGEVDTFPKTQWIEWKIKDFFLSGMECKPYWSPEFSLHGESWNLVTYLNAPGYSDSPEYDDSLYLVRTSDGSSINVKISVGLKTVNGEKQIEREFTKVFEPNKSTVLVISQFISKAELKKRWSELVPSGTLTFICSMTVLPSTGNENAVHLPSQTPAECITFNVTSVCEDAPSTLPALHEAPEMPGEEIVDSSNKTSENNTVFPLKSLAKKKKIKPIHYFPLPEFSKEVQPVLNGEILTEKIHAQLNSQLKEELISYMNRENLICSENTSRLRWEYRNLGENLARKYPKMLWDLPSKRQKKFQKQNAPIYEVFIHRLSQRRKMQSLRKKVKVRKEINFTDNMANDAFEVPRVDVVSELKVSGLVYPCALPKFSAVVEQQIQNETVHQNYGRFVRECAAFLLTLTEKPSRSDYDVYCKTLTDKYKFLGLNNIPGSTPYAFLKKSLSHSIRNARHYTKKKEKNSSTVKVFIDTEKAIFSADDHLTNKETVRISSDDNKSHRFQSSRNSQSATSNSVIVDDAKKSLANYQLQKRVLRKPR